MSDEPRPQETIILSGGRHDGTVLEVDRGWRTFHMPAAPPDPSGVWTIVGYFRTGRTDAEGRAVFACEG